MLWPELSIGQFADAEAQEDPYKVERERYITVTGEDSELPEM